MKPAVPGSQATHTCALTLCPYVLMCPVSRRCSLQLCHSWKTVLIWPRWFPSCVHAIIYQADFSWGILLIPVFPGTKMLLYKSLLFPPTPENRHFTVSRCTLPSPSALRPLRASDVPFKVLGVVHWCYTTRTSRQTF